MKKQSILIVYILTGKYNAMFEGFHKTVTRFCPNSNITIHRMTDESPSNKIEEEHTSYIPHQPWPIVALLKFHHIRDAVRKLEARGEYYDYVFYFNSNIEFLEDCPEEVFLGDKLIAVHNIGWDYLGHDPLNFTYGKPLDPKSATYIEGYYEYLQSCLFGGPTNMILDACEEVIEMIDYDLAHNRIPVFHDETTWNKYCHTNQEKVNIISNEWCMDKVNAEKYGYPNAKIVMRDSSVTQYEYKDKFHK